MDIVFKIRNYMSNKFTLNSLIYILDALNVKSDLKFYSIKFLNDNLPNIYTSLSLDNAKILKLLDWRRISCMPNLSIDFIETFKDYLDWDIITILQDLNYCYKFENKLNWSLIEKNKTFNLEILKNFAICNKQAMKFLNNKILKSFNEETSL